MQLHFLSALAIFISGYAPLGLILVVKDLNEHTAWFEHPTRVVAIAALFVVCALITLSAARNIKQGVPVKINGKAAIRNGDPAKICDELGTKGTVVAVGTVNIGD